MAPPPDETPQEREARLEKEREAKKISDGIDEQLKAEKEAIKARLKARKEIKVLLLGQSESGKSTTLKRRHRILAADISSFFARIPTRLYT